MGEIIHLHGGPADFETRVWCGGNVFEIREMPLVPVVSNFPELSEPIAARKGYYRRDGKSKHFMWQGWE